MTRILILSDITTWAGCKELVSFHKPEVVLLAGDLTWDGFAEQHLLERIPAFVREKKALARKYGVMMLAANSFSCTNEAEWPEFSAKLGALENAYRDSPEYEAARRRLHVDAFYGFLRFAGKTTSVLVVKGDHDDDFAGDYDTERISRIHGCREISGDVVTIQGLRFLGLGYKQTHFKKTLLDFVNSFKGKVDVVVAHSEQSRVPLVGEIEPRLLARGHFGYGRYFVNGVPSVFTGGPFYCEADLGEADLSDANLGNADLTEADLKYASLYCANLRAADLRCADLSGATLNGTIFGNTNLKGVVGLDAIRHRGPSVIDHSTPTATRAEAHGTAPARAGPAANVWVSPHWLRPGPA